MPFIYSIEMIELFVLFYLKELKCQNRLLGKKIEYKQKPYGFFYGFANITIRTWL